VARYAAAMAGGRLAVDSSAGQWLGESEGLDGARSAASTRDRRHVYISYYHMVRVALCVSGGVMRVTRAAQAPRMGAGTGESRSR